MNFYPYVLIDLSTPRTMHLLTTVSKKETNPRNKWQGFVSTPLSTPGSCIPGSVCLSGKSFFRTDVAHYQCHIIDHLGSRFQELFWPRRSPSEVSGLRVPSKGAPLLGARSALHGLPASLHQSMESLPMWWFCFH